jgi:hypothetical protein
MTNRGNIQHTGLGDLWPNQGAVSLLSLPNLTVRVIVVFRHHRRLQTSKSCIGIINISILQWHRNVLALLPRLDSRVINRVPRIDNESLATKLPAYPLVKANRRSRSRLAFEPSIE